MNLLFKNNPQIGCLTDDYQVMFMLGLVLARLGGGVMGAGVQQRMETTINASKFESARAQ